MRVFIGSWLAIAFLGGIFLLFDYFQSDKLITNVSDGPDTRYEKSLAERIGEAEERSQNVKGLYMTATVANDQGPAATELRNNVLRLLTTTELDGLVIDVKETEGGLVVDDQLRGLLAELHQKGIWVIARQVVFKDSSQEKDHPSWYLMRRDGRLWRDNRGGSWLDPSSPEVWAYQLSAAKAASEAGFDEIQFDYIRFPSDGDVRNIVYPAYDGKQPKYEVLRKFFDFLHQNLKAYRPELILSADLFGHVALESEDLGIGQRLHDIGENFDYVSLMVYPSHYYGGFDVPADPDRNLPALYYPYRSPNISEVAVHHPYEVVYRTLLIAEDILAGRIATATGEIAGLPRPKSGLGEIGKTSTSSILTIPSSRRAKLRPWLQDFDLAVDSTRGIRYDSAKVRAQIDAAETAGSSGWLLWNAANVYTKEALKPE